MGWLAAAQAAAREAALDEDRRARGWAPGGERLPAFGYRWEHVRLVARNGRWLLDRHPAADAEVLIAACWLHDARKLEPEHARRGADFARTFLAATDFPAAKIPQVAAAIALHEGMWRPAPSWTPDAEGPMPVAPPLQPLEAALLWDADKLSKVSPLGMLHWLPTFVYSLDVADKPLGTEALLAQNQRWMALLRARTLPSFNSEAARQRGARLLAQTERFWQAASDEWGPDDE